MHTNTHIGEHISARQKISIAVFYYSVHWHHWRDYLVIRYDSRTSSNFYYPPPLLQILQLFTPWFGTWPQNDLYIFSFQLRCWNQIAHFCSPSQTPDASWLEQIFSLARQSWQMWWFVILSFTHLAVPRYFTPKYTEIKQLSQGASATVILTGASGTENLISEHWQIKEANLYLSEMLLFLFFIYWLYFLSSLPLVCNF